VITIPNHEPTGTSSCSFEVEQFVIWWLDATIILILLPELAIMELCALKDEGFIKSNFEYMILLVLYFYTKFDFTFIIDR
jgi:hypothetical protein